MSVLGKTVILYCTLHPIVDMDKSNSLLTKSWAGPLRLMLMRLH